VSTHPLITTPLVFNVEVKATASNPAFIAKAMLDGQRNQYYAFALTLEHMDVRLTSARVQATPVQKTMAPILRSLLAEANPSLVLEHPLVRKWATGKAQRPVAAKQIVNPDPATLTGASLVYRLAKLSGEAPVKATARAAGIAHEDAQRWIKTARKQSLL